ncbi:MAG TPA: hypothetical protein VMD09_10220 [Solirubrobacteraceae bacterium]|nr:hypothetical protein [Solirubrobacteraceae bacterium]
MSIDPRFERSILAEFALRERRARRREGSHSPRALAKRLHGGRGELVSHLRRVAHAVPRRFRAVAWLHHAHEADVTARALVAAGLTKDERTALTLLAAPRPDQGSVLRCVRALSKAPGAPGYLARVVARAAIEDRLGGAPPTGETLTALRLLPDPELTR